MYIADNAGGNTNSHFSCNSYRSLYCDNYQLLDDDMGIISAQMSWRFIMKCLLETGRQH